MAGVNAIAGSTGAQTFSYNLIGRVTKVKPHRTIKLEREVYQAAMVDVQVLNSSAHDGLFKVSLVEAVLNHPLPYPMEMIAQSMAISHTPDQSVRPITEFTIANTSTNKLFLRADEETNISIQYVPLLSTTKRWVLSHDNKLTLSLCHSCYIILENDDCGTMISRIVARATLPQPKGL